ncbi:MAG: lipoprotein [Thiohalocapsa sp.]|jgi:predicted small lipoprotein YifL|uniref:LPS translocon maturation chaperone LptM n=1 Tax=Thiohalocapsa sp. TaxID=2497641 RepID=UPI0025FBFA48|nr:hypothetical protein [Thiohalocapsa sp.]MCG6940595.1 lipoprotein [Thiohalocapsa sp.]
MQSRRRPLLTLLTIALVVAIAAPLVGCGQNGDLYLAEDDPARAERDARGKGKPFPFPPESAEWPPEAPTNGTAAGTAPAANP